MRPLPALWPLAGLSIATGCSAVLGIHDISPPDVGRGDASTDGASSTDGSPDAIAEGDAPIGPEADAAMDSADVLDTTPDHATSLPGCPTGTGHLLLGDTSGDAIDYLDLTGKVVHHLSSPVPGVTGVTFDRRTAGAIWVARGDGIGPTLTQLDLMSGAVLGTIDESTFFTGSPMRGLDYALGATPDGDTLIIETVSNGADGVVGIRVIAGDSGMPGDRTFQSLFFVSAVTRNGYWGVSAASFGPGGFGTTDRFWATSAGHLQDWVFDGNAPRSDYATPAAIPRGVAVTPQGDFWLVDLQGTRVLHLNDNGVADCAFSTPESDPAGISFM